MAESGGIRTEGADQLDQIARALHEAADRELTNRVRRSMREVAKPAGEIVVRAGAVRMPKRGGFSARVAASKVGIQSAIASKRVHVTISLKNAGSDLASLNRGILRKPVFARPGRKRIWRTQHVPAKTFTEALEAQAPIVRQQVLDAMQSTLNDAAGKVH